MTNRTVHIIGGGTVNHVRPHFALSAPAYGGTARRLKELCEAHDTTMEVRLHLTKMADHTSNVETNDDLRELALALVKERTTKIVFMNAAVADFEGTVEPTDKTYAIDEDGPAPVHSGRLHSARASEYEVRLRASSKILPLFRNTRKDIFLVGFKATAAATSSEQYQQGLDMLKRSSANLVLANDVVTGNNLIITPEEAVYHETKDREEALHQLVDMAYLRSHLTFTRSTVVAGEPVAWSSDLVPGNLRTVVDHCIQAGAYKRFRGVTAGHFAVRLSSDTFLTSRRKTDFNDMARVGLVKVKTDGPDTVVAYGSRPSVGGQSQRIVFSEHPGTDCIVHFHCPKKPDSKVPSVSQREFECGSHQCGENTSRGLSKFGNLYAVYLENHGPNIVFSRDTDPQEVIDFIEANFDLTQKSGGYQLAA